MTKWQEVLINWMIENPDKKVCINFGRAAFKNQFYKLILDQIKQREE